MFLKTKKEPLLLCKCLLSKYQETRYKTQINYKSKNSNGLMPASLNLEFESYLVLVSWFLDFLFAHPLLKFCHLLTTYEGFFVNGRL